MGPLAMINVGKPVTVLLQSSNTLWLPNPSGDVIYHFNDVH